MAKEKRDPVTGRMTTGHEWNGIEELNTPVPRVVLFFLAAGTLFCIGYWLLMPAWPLGWTYTKGLLGIDQREIVTRQVQDAAKTRAIWTDRIAAADFAQISSDESLMRHVRETGRTLFIDNCAACHGLKGTGSTAFPNLTAGKWLWGGDPKTIAETIRIGINSTHRNTRSAQMLAFGRDGILNRQQVLDVLAFVESLSKPDAKADPKSITAGKEVYAANCASCHGESGKGNPELGAPDLTDAYWLYGGDTQSIYTSIYHGRQGQMPHWEDRLTPVEIKLLALYVSTLRGGVGGKQ